MNTQITETTARQQTLLAEAVDWRLISLLFECPVNDWRAQAQALAAESQDATLREAVAAIDDNATEGVYHSLFGPGGPAPPREISYRREIQPGFMLSELTCCYDAFAWRPQTVEAPDHIAVQTGFIGWLRLKEAYALACQDTEHAAITAEAADSFLRGRLANIAEPMAGSLAHSGVPYLALAARALLDRVGPRPAQPTAHVLPVLTQNEADESAEFACAED